MGCVSTPGTTYVDTPIPERSTRFVGMQLRDAAGEPLTSTAQVESVRFTLTDVDGNVINGRDGVEVKGANGGELSATGWFSQELTPADTRAFGPDVLQPRRALFEVEFDATRRENHVVALVVESLPGVS